jgi:hypothetical protein
MELSIGNRLSLFPLAAFACLFGIFLSGAVPDAFLVLFVMLLLAEPHFAAGWPYMLDSRYREKFSQRPFALIVVPLLIVMSAIAIYVFLGSAIFAYVFLAANIYHVNRQSLGIMKFLGMPKEIFEPAAIDCHIPSIVFLVYHFTLIDSERVWFNPVVVLMLVSIYMAVRYRVLNKDGVEASNLRYISSVAQATLIWFPLTLTSNPLVALAVGVSIHYVQYILLTGAILGREGKIVLFVLFLVLYSAVTTLVQTIGVEAIGILILVAAIPQLLHFYLDGFFWRMSESIIRERVAPIL